MKNKKLIIAASVFGISFVSTLVLHMCGMLTDNWVEFIKWFGPTSTAIVLFPAAARDILTSRGGTNGNPKVSVEVDSNSPCLCRHGAVDTVLTGEA